ncbi:MAG: crossover junction endodeoxyribonuclease RuvC [Ignavibacteriae bacterium]|nr:MAG: crossover junction endodeoxyribonuclease RuvC [Ignavibacteriota bacterium]
MRILGIDPGSVICGYGVIDVQGSAMTVVEYGVIHVKRHKSSFPQRLVEIHERLTAVISRSKPDVCALEMVFYAKNVKSVVQLAHARGVSMLACASAGLDPIEYTPMQIKRSVTGRGASSKQQVSHMVSAILKLDESPEFLDATDALAVAICHAVNLGRPEPIIKQRSKGGTRGAWKEFLERRGDV